MRNVARERMRGEGETTAGDKIPIYGCEILAPLVSFRTKKPAGYTNAYEKEKKRKRERVAQVTRSLSRAL